MLDYGTLVAGMGIDATQYFETITESERRAEAWAKNIAKAFGEAGKAANEKFAQPAIKWLGEHSKALEKTGKDLTKKLTTPILAAGTAVAKMAIDWESSFAGVRKTVDGTEEEFAALERQMKELSLVTPLNPNALNQIAELAGQLGIGIREIAGFTDVVAKMGVSTSLSTEEAAMSMARFINITQQVADSNMDVVEQTQRIGATIVDLGNNFATTEPEIMSFAMRLAGAGAQAKISQAEILGWSAALSSVGLNAEAGGTAISRVWATIQAATKEGGAELQKFAEVAGMSVDAFVELFEQDATEATLRFIEGLDAISESGGNVYAVLEELSLNEIRVRDALLRTSGATDVLRSAMEMANRAYDENNALNAEAAKRYGTTESQLALARNKFMGLADTLGRTLLPHIITLAEQAGVLALRFEAWAKQNPKLIEQGMKLAGVLVTLGPALVVFGTLSGALNKIWVAGSKLLTLFAALKAQLSFGAFAAQYTWVTSIAPALSNLAANLGAVTTAAGTAASAIAAFFAPIAAVGAAVEAKGTQTIRETADAITLASNAARSSAGSYEEYRQRVMDAAMATGYYSEQMDKEVIWQSLVNRGLAMGELHWESYNSKVQQASPYLDEATMAHKRLRDEAQFLGKTVAETASQVQRYGASIMNTVNGIVDGTIARFRAAVPEFQKVISQALSDADVAEQLAEVQGVLYDHGQQMQQLYAEHQQNLLDLQFQYQLDAQQAQMDFDREYQALVAAGKDKEAAKLELKYSEQRAMAEREYDIQQQLAERNYLMQQLQQKQAHLAELEELRDQTLRVIQQKILAAAEEQDLDAQVVETALRMVALEGSERLRIETETYIASMNLAKEFAQGRIDLEEQLATALAAIDSGIATTSDEIANLKSQIANFKVNLPPLPAVDMRLLDGSLNKATSSVKKKTESATREVGEVMSDIARMVSDAVDTIDKLVDFDLPDGVETGLQRVARFIAQAVQTIYDALPGMKPGLKATKDYLEPMSKLVSVIRDGAQMLQDLAKDTGQLPDMQQWMGRYLAVLKVVYDGMVWASQHVIGQESLEKVAKMSEPIQALMNIAKYDFAAITDTEIPDMKTWFNRFLEVFRVMYDGLIWTSQHVVEREWLARVKQIVEPIQAIMDVAKYDFAEVVDTRIPHMDVWFNRFLEVLRVMYDGLIWADNHIIERHWLERIALLAAPIQGIMDIAAYDFAKIVDTPIPNMKTWFNRFLSVLRVMYDGLIWVDQNIVERSWLERIANLAGPLKQVVDVALVDLSKISDAPIPDMHKWMGRFVSAARWTANAITAVRLIIGDETLEAAGKAAESITKIMDVLGLSMKAAEDPPEDQNILRWMGYFTGTARWVANAVNAVRGFIGDDALKAAGEAAESIKSIMDVLSISLEAKPVPFGGFMANLIDFLAQLHVASEHVIEKLDMIYQQYGKPGKNEETSVLEKAKTTAEALRSIFDLFSTDLNLKVGAETFVDDLAVFVDRLELATDELVDRLEAIQEDYGDGLKAAAEAATSVKSITELLGADLTFKLPTQADYVTRLRLYLDSLQFAARELKTMLDKVQAEYGTDEEDANTVLGKAAETAQLLTDIFGLLSVDLSEIKGWDTRKGSLSSVVTKFAQDIYDAGKIMRDTMLQANTDYGEGLEQAAQTAGYVGEMISTIRQVSQDLWAAWDEGGIDYDAVRILVGQLYDAAGLIASQGLPPGMVATPPTTTPPGIVQPNTGTTNEPVGADGKKEPLPIRITLTQVVNQEVVADYTIETIEGEELDIRLHDIGVLRGAGV
jgi:TP901 family phage tail tape measure protein